MLKGKVAIITGGTRGIGLEIVKNYLKNGAKVALLGSKKESVDKALENLSQEFDKDSVIGYYPNISNELEVSDTFKEINNHFGKIDILVIFKNTITWIHRRRTR